jgi:hypothetical protein
MAGGKCGACAFWNEKGASMGQCRRHAPVTDTSRPGEMTKLWPWTEKYDGCGDYQWISPHARSAVWPDHG